MCAVGIVQILKLHLLAALSNVALHRTVTEKNKTNTTVYGRAIMESEFGKRLVCDLYHTTGIHGVLEAFENLSECDREESNLSSSR